MTSRHCPIERNSSSPKHIWARHSTKKAKKPRKSIHITKCGRVFSDQFPRRFWKGYRLALKRTHGTIPPIEYANTLLGPLRRNSSLRTLRHGMHIYNIAGEGARRPCDDEVIKVSSKQSSNFKFLKGKTTYEDELRTSKVESTLLGYGMFTRQNFQRLIDPPGLWNELREDRTSKGESTLLGYGML
ncbi:hypothetical protein AVEN_108285-1 [Araneus ventricosus]|uniref:Uncharacterized protein n=1 Tax=Araneus ventricosus TaxID=182803 RepID=A0A4Y2TT20_ARAVE|nr:hypothetical protein AVEN_108285-1 [Araneus ventricosus]